MSSPSPLVRAGVVIPAHGDAAVLARVLVSTAAVDWPAEQLRVCVSLDGPDERLERVAREAGAEVVSLPTNQGSYAARNAGVEALGDDVDFVAFTDSDCIVSPGWLTAHAAALGDLDLSAGGIRVTLRPKPSPAEFIDKHRHLHQQAYVEIDRYGATANLAVRREVLAKLTFNPALRSGGDIEFCHRAQDAGFTLGYTDDAWVEHPARRTSREVMRKIRRICTGIQGNPGRWETRPLPPAFRNLYYPREAYHAGHSSPVWLLRTWVLGYRSSVRIRRTVVRLKKANGWPL